MTPDVSVLIVAYNCQTDLEQCLHSLQHCTTRYSLELIVVDNHSADGTVQMLATRFPDVRLIANTTNTGFAHANNQGLALARGRFILCLNPDTIILDDALDIMVDTLSHRPDIGLVGPHTYNADRRTTQVTVYADHCLLTVFHCQIPLFKHLLRPARTDTYLPVETTAVDVVRGCCMMLPAHIFRAVGGMSERYFMYTEEYELCRVVRAHGYSVVYVHNAHIVHSEGRSSSADTTSGDPMLRQRLAVQQDRSLLLYFRAHLPDTPLLLLRLTLLAGCLWRYALFAGIAPWFPSRRTRAYEHRSLLAARIRWLLTDFS